ncbi:MAG: hypothetical protein ACJAYF_000891 [Arenicella sp.]|jgi:hypothetical protein
MNLVYKKMKCLEFKRLALSDPNSSEHNFVEHSANCPQCLKYVGGVRQMDADLASSVDVAIPSDLMARLQLNQELSEEVEYGATKSALRSALSIRRYAIAASFALAVFVAGFMASNQFSGNSSIEQDYQALLSGVVEHMNEQAITPVWNPERANSSAAALLAGYDPEIKLKFLDSLQFSRICPMGKYLGLHATLETTDGQVTFAYIKGNSVSHLLDAGYEGYVSRIKPVRGGNLIIMSRTSKGLEEADSQLEKAMYWDI